jgi:hypothetical protein
MTHVRHRHNWVANSWFVLPFLALDFFLFNAVSDPFKEHNFFSSIYWFWFIVYKIIYALHMIYWILWIHLLRKFNLDLLRSEADYSECSTS